MEKRIIPDFPDYEVSDDGRVFKRKTGRELTYSPVGDGTLTVGLRRDHYQYRRSIKILVAKAFVEGETDVFDTPTLLDGNKQNLSYTNIVWRPRWFAWEYTHQLHFPQDWYSIGRVLDTTQNVIYRNVIDAAMTNGLLAKEVRLSMMDDRRVFPTGQRFAHYV